MRKLGKIKAGKIRVGKIMWIFGVLLVAVIALLWVGLQIRPGPFAPYGGVSIEPRREPLPPNLPEPVARFYRAILLPQQEIANNRAETISAPRDSAASIEIPVITSAVISGRARLRIAGITLPARFRFIHRAGYDYRHYIETTFFGLPFLRINEYYLDGNSRLELPFGVVENEPRIAQAANLGLWAESIWLPSLFLTDPRVSWQAVDAHTAWLVVPGPASDPATETATESERFLVRFDPETGLIDVMESMRYKDAADSAKTLWINQTLGWASFAHAQARIDGSDSSAGAAWQLPVRAALIWFDEGTPWAIFEIDEVVYNLDVDEAVRRSGP